MSFQLDTADYRDRIKQLQAQLVAVTAERDTAKNEAFNWKKEALAGRQITADVRCQHKAEVERLKLPAIKSYEDALNNNERIAHVKEAQFRALQAQLAAVTAERDELRQRCAAHECVAGPLGTSVMLSDGTKVRLVRGEGAEAAHVWLEVRPAERINALD